MNCFEPGQVLILPSKDGDQRTLGMISERLNQRFEIIYSIEDVLQYYGLGSTIEGLVSQFGALPFVVRVPEGDELLLSTQFRTIPEVKTSVPNYHISTADVTPTINHEWNHEWIEEALSRTNALPMQTECGAGVRVAILDTGVNPSELKTPGALQPYQYDAERSCDLTTQLAPKDERGHGTVVAHIVNRIAPSAQLLSVKTLSQHGTIGSVLAALYLAEAEFRPDIYNLSLSVSCDAELCQVCDTPRNLAVNGEQLRSLFAFLQYRTFPTVSPPLLVAAAGNNRTRVCMPAAFSNVIAVGSYDIKNNREAKYSSYTQVPQKRFFLAPGGNRDPKDSIATGCVEGWNRKPSICFGTSFATAFVTGISARYLCAVKGKGGCARLGGEYIDLNAFEFVTEVLHKSADKSWPGYNVTKHGGGIARYDLSVAQEALSLFAGGTQHAKLPSYD